MKFKTVLLMIAIPFCLVFAGEENKTSVVDSLSCRADTAKAIENHLLPMKINLSQEQESVNEPKYDRVNKEKILFLVCAGRYGNRADAERHIEALKKLGYSSKLTFDGQKDYRVVLKKVKGITKAEKIKAHYQKSGITCFVEQE